MNTKVCAILFAGATLATEGNSDQPLAKIEEPTQQGWVDCIKTYGYEACVDTISSVKRTLSKALETNGEANAKKGDRTAALYGLVTKLKNAIEQLQKPAGCDQNAEESKQVQKIINNAIQTVVKSLEEFQANLPEGVKAWMEDAKQVLLDFSKKMNGQPTEEDMKSLIAALNIEELKEAVENAKDDTKMKPEDKKFMLDVQAIVAPLENVKDLKSLFEILTTECIPKMQQLEDDKIAAFVETATKWLDDIPRIVGYMQCQASQGKTEV